MISGWDRRGTLLKHYMCGNLCGNVEHSPPAVAGRTVEGRLETVLGGRCRCNGDFATTTGCRGHGQLRRSGLTFWINVKLVVIAEIQRWPYTINGRGF